MHSIFRTLTQLQLSVFRCGLRRRFATNHKYTETWVVNTYEIHDHNTNKPTKDRFVWISPFCFYRRVSDKIPRKGIFLAAANGENEKFMVIAHKKGEVDLQDNYVVGLTPEFSEYPSWEFGQLYKLKRTASFTTMFTFLHNPKIIGHSSKVIKKIDPLLSISRYEPSSLFTDSDWKTYCRYKFS